MYLIILLINFFLPGSEEGTSTTSSLTSLTGSSIGLSSKVTGCSSIGCSFNNFFLWFRRNFFNWLFFNWLFFNWFFFVFFLWFN
ncbi:hypothetical protein H8356DRAFT_1702507 [Neocallimastix lanati (nom. inval.)]|nr:hypothetical protein H8356DRAFT_1702507 [Neocallimastix sp. JGI-2020a]